jgi:hypothetical protein
MVALRAIKNRKKCLCANLFSFVVVLLVLSLVLASCAGPVKCESVEQTKIELEKLDPLIGSCSSASDCAGSGEISSEVS